MDIIHSITCNCNSVKCMYKLLRQVKAFLHLCNTYKGSVCKSLDSVSLVSFLKSGSRSLFFFKVYP